MTIQLEEINQKVLAKEGKLKRYRARVKQYKQNRTLKKTRKNSTDMQGDIARRHTNRLMQGKQKKFGAKYDNQDNITKKPNGYATWDKS